MKTPPRILWTEGVTLRPQHFQQQDRYHEARLHRMATALHPYAWGLAAATWNEEALANNILQVESLSLVFPDGETYDAPGSDPLPEAVELAALPPSESHFTFYAALPMYSPYGGNLAGCRQQDDRQARFRQLEMETPDLYTEALESNIVYLAKQARLLSQLMPRTGYVSNAVLRIRRCANGGLEIDPAFIPPSMSVAAAPALARLLDALMQKLQAKLEALYAVQREPSKDVVVQGGDQSSFLLLQTISSGCAALHHHARCPGFHPERLFQDLLALAGGLMAFSRKFRIKDLPGYDHEQPGPAFARLNAVLRDLVDTVISSTCLVIPLVQDAARPSYYNGRLPENEVDQKALLCLGVRAELPALELVAAVPARFKVGSPEDTGRLVASALPGVELVHMPQVPATVPVRPNTCYFALQGKGPLYASMLQERAVSVYVPSGIRELFLELFVLAS